MSLNGPSFLRVRLNQANWKSHVHGQSSWAFYLQMIELLLMPHGLFWHEQDSSLCPLVPSLLPSAHAGCRGQLCAVKDVSKEPLHPESRASTPASLVSCMIPLSGPAEPQVTRVPLLFSLITSCPLSCLLITRWFLNYFCCILKSS